MGEPSPMHRSRATRHLAAHRRQPDCESLEVRTLLSLAIAPIPAQDASSASGTDFDALIGASRARSTYGVDGTGLSAAVIDLGVSYENPALGGRIGPDAKVKTGFDFAENDEDPHADTSQHGTSVAGLIASTDADHPGVAPGAGIVPLRVFGDDEVGSYEWIAQALRWILANRKQYDISVVNISSSDGGNYLFNKYADGGGTLAKLTSLVAQLKEVNIPVVVASGNSFDGQAQGMGFAAIVADTISVTSTDANDQLADGAQRLGPALGGAFATDIAAPGVGVVAPAGASGFMALSGTSFSTPLVSGSILLLQQIYMNRFGSLPTVDMLDAWLQAGSDPTTDPATHLNLGRLDVAASAALIPGPPTEPVASVTPPATIARPPADPQVSSTETIIGTPMGENPQTTTPPPTTTKNPAITPPPTNATLPPTSIPPAPPIVRPADPTKSPTPTTPPAGSPPPSTPIPTPIKPTSKPGAPLASVASPTPPPIAPTTSPIPSPAPAFVTPEVSILPTPDPASSADDATTGTIADLPNLVPHPASAAVSWADLFLTVRLDRLGALDQLSTGSERRLAVASFERPRVRLRNPSMRRFPLVRHAEAVPRPPRLRMISR